MKKYLMEFNEQLGAYFNNRFPVFCFQMEEAVDCDKLTRAVCESLKYHPIFATRMMRGTNGQFWLEENSSEPVIRKCQWNDRILYGTKEMHEFPWIITYCENQILFSCSHALSDGNGVLTFMHSVLGFYLYYQGKIERKILDACHPSDPDRTTENSSLANVDPDNVPLGNAKMHQPAILPESMYAAEQDEINSYRFTLPLEAIEKKAKDAEVTTFAVISAFLARGMEHMINMPDADIQVCVAVNLRKMFESVTEHNFTHTALLNYPVGKCSKLPMEMVETMFRSQLDLSTERSNLINTFNQASAGMQALEADPKFLEKCYKQIYNMLYLPQASFVYTHLTKLPFQECILDHLKDFEIIGTPENNKLIVVLARTLRDNVSMAVYQATKKDCLINCVEEVLREEKMPYQIEKMDYHGSLLFNSDIYRDTEFYLKD